MTAKKAVSYRILVVDDNPAIHDDFRKILAPKNDHGDLNAFEAALFGETSAVHTQPVFQIDFASQGEEGLRRVHQAIAEQRPYAMAFIDVRMPPGWDGIETIGKIWALDANIQTVICTAYSDYSWWQIRDKLGHSDRLVILKKPFDNIEVLQLADTLCHRWQLASQAKGYLADLQQMIAARTHELQASKKQLAAANQQLSGNDERAALDTQARQRLVLKDRLRAAIDKGEFKVFYQPLVEIATRRTIGLEALLRWPQPQGGFVSPAEFIPLAEESGLILPLGEFVLRNVCQQMVRWQREQVPTVPVAVNISAVQLQNQHLPELVGSVLRETGLAPQDLAVELTESALISNAKNHIDELQALRDSGVRVELDDFGTGYSSLSYLKHLPIDTIKIDRSFINQIDSNARDQSIMSALLAMSHSLGLTVVAEGVETVAQLNILQRLGCEFAQGFFFSRPLPAEEIRSLLLKLAARPSFTDTLRVQLASGGDVVPLTLRNR